MRKPKHNQHASFAEPVSTFRWGNGNSVIYAWCQGASEKLFLGQWLAEDGRGCGKAGATSLEMLQYIMSDAPAETSQATFRATYPSGYRIEWVPMNQVRQHKGLLEAYSRNQAAGRKAAQKCQ